MARGFDPGALLGQVYTLPTGRRVSLRLLRPSDAGGVRELCARCGIDVGELSLARLARADPRREVILCATSFMDRQERLVGIGSLALDTDQRFAEILVDPDGTHGLHELLSEAVEGRAAALRDAQAA